MTVDAVIFYVYDIVYEKSKATNPADNDIK